MMVGAELFEPGRFDLNYSDYKAQVEDNPDSQNRELALERLIHQATSVGGSWTFTSAMRQTRISSWQLMRACRDC
jgi:hypothetical protein